MAFQTLFRWRFPVQVAFLGQNKLQNWPDFQSEDKSLVLLENDSHYVDVLENDIEPVAPKHGKWSPQGFFSSQFTISKPLQSVDCFSHTLSTFQFVLNHRVSFTQPSDLLVCVCEKGFEVACVRLLNQYLLHPFQLWDLTSSVYLSPSPQPSQNAYIDAPSLAAFPREKGVPAATPTGVMEHPGPCQPMLAAESTAHADRRLQERPGIFILSAVIENTTSHTQYHSAYIYVCF